MRINPLWECHSAEALTADQMISSLNTGMDRRDHQSAKCICAYVQSLASAKDERAIPAIAQYLDLPNPLTSAEHAAHISDLRWSPLGYRYPAQEALTEFHQFALPMLIQTIQSETTFSQKSENALQLVMWICDVYPDRTIKMLVDATARTSGTQAEKLRLAVSKAMAMPECERVRPACENVAVPKESAAPVN